MPPSALLEEAPRPVVAPPGPEAWDAARRMTAIHKAPLSPEDKELAGLSLMLDLMHLPMEPGDLLAGRVQYPLVGVSPEPGGLGWYARLSDLPPDLADYWRGRTTSDLVRAWLPDWAERDLPSDDWQAEAGLAFPLYRIAGIQLDYPRLLARGIPAEVKDILAPVFARHGLDRLLEGPPQSFRDAIQLFWLYGVSSGTWNWGRLDVALGPFLTADLDHGRMTEEEALELLQSLWRLMGAYDNMYNNRVILGGKGRPDEIAADAFALLALEATRTVCLNQPQLTLRFYEGQNPALMEKALDVLAEGRTFPILYNDDVNIPGVSRAFRTTLAKAENYLPYGCGEYMIWPKTISSPNGVINLPLCLLQAMEEAGSDFDAVWDAYDRKVTRLMEALAVFHITEYQVVFDQLQFPLIRALYDEAFIFTAAVETYGNTNTADSLVALKRGPGAPRYGNDDEEADAMALRVHNHVCQRATEAGDKHGILQLVVQVNNSANVILGRHTPATPDGRSAGEPFANGNNPSPGADRSGVTAFLLSLAKPPAHNHACTVQNMKFSKGMFRDRARLKALLDVYWARGGTQAMITVVDRRDLEQAMEEPEKWGHLMVRVGGFSARFVDLPRDVQLEVLGRTLHE